MNFSFKYFQTNAFTRDIHQLVGPIWDAIDMRASKASILICGPILVIPKKEMKMNKLTNGGKGESS